MMVSSWSRPSSDNPLGCSAATTLQGRLLTRITLPIGSSTPKSCSRTVRPMTHTSAARSTSSSENIAPSSTYQRLMSKYSGETPRYEVCQFWLPYTTCTGSSTLGETLLISETWFLMAIASAMTSVFVSCVPVRTPLTARPPASTQTKLSPSLLSCCSTRAWPALPIDTTQMTAAIPMVMPSTVKTLRILLRSSATTADRSKAVRFTNFSLLNLFLPQRDKCWINAYASTFRRPQWEATAGACASTHSPCADGIGASSLAPRAP